MDFGRGYSPKFPKNKKRGKPYQPSGKQAFQGVKSGNWGKPYQLSRLSAILGMKTVQGVNPEGEKMPSKDTKIISGRVPNRVDFSGISIGKILTSVYDLYRLGIIDIIDGEIVIPDRDDIEVERFEDIP